MDRRFCDSIAVLGICGRSGSGKTALIEMALPHLQKAGIRTAVIKHASHRIEADSPGKDSGRFFRQKSDVLIHTPTELMFRAHKPEDFSLQYAIRELSRCYDLILVEGHKQTLLPKFWLASRSDQLPDGIAEPVIQILSPECGRLSILLNHIQKELPRILHQTPLYGGVLIGGKSLRMGSPKHLLNKDGLTWLERTIEILRRRTARNVIIGNGDIPPSLNGLLRLPDAEACNGPMAGLLSAMRWAPHASWIICACDMPNLSPDSLEWLCQQRRAGRWIVMPSIADDRHVEPLYAYYDFRSASLLERQLAEGNFRLSDLARHPKTAVIQPPAEIRSSWRNANSAEDLSPIS
ncbi:MAG: molybdopterin-guanine dinucleotide biosynthesis protein B [Candidatus Omnitrophota bacterium]